MTTNNKKLKILNSFSIDVQAHRVIPVYTEATLLKLCQQAAKKSIPTIVLGGGNNVLFLEDYKGIVLLNRITGITIKEHLDSWHLHVGAGEIWHNFVSICLKKNMPGLENLAYIPGYVGSAPIQNIGAYNVELCQFCKYVDVLQLITGTIYRLSASECLFGYRNSIFKHKLRKNNVIIAVGIRLTKAWQPILTYSDLSHLDPCLATPELVYNVICNVRRKKIPDPKLQGNAGSFFKNPIVSNSIATDLLNRYPNLPYYLHPEGGVKISAGWLIDQCGLKGYRIGNAAVHDKQALILINSNNNATVSDIIALARYIRQRVAEKFTILLEPEVRFIGAFGEVDAVKVIT